MIVLTLQLTFIFMFWDSPVHCHSFEHVYLWFRDMTNDTDEQKDTVCSTSRVAEKNPSCIMAR